MTRFDLITVGDNCIDRLAGALTADLVGGNAVNVAVQAAGLGLRVACITAVGPNAEADGDRIVEALAATGVEVGRIERRAAPTSVTVLRVGADGNRTILTEDFGACAHWSPDATSIPLLTAARHVHIGWLQDGGQLRAALAAAGGSVSQDVSVNAAPADLGVAGVSLAFASLPEARAAEAGARAAELVAQGAKAAVVTLGAAGSLALIDGHLHHAPAVQITPTDTTGAGDAYIAGFLAARLNGADVPMAMAAGLPALPSAAAIRGAFPSSANAFPLFTTPTRSLWFRDRPGIAQCSTGFIKEDTMTEKPFPTEAQIAAALAAAKSRPALTEIYFVACGGSYALMLPNQYAVDRHGKTIAAHALNAAEFLARNPARLGPTSTVILCSHSGTTPETVEAAQFARAKGALTIALTKPARQPAGSGGGISGLLHPRAQDLCPRSFGRSHGPADLWHPWCARGQPVGGKGAKGAQRPASPD